MTGSLWQRLRLSMRVHGPLDGILVTAFRACYRRRLMRLGYAVQSASDYLENYWFQRRLRQHGFGRDDG